LVIIHYMVRDPAAAGLNGNGGPNTARRPSEKRCRTESALVFAASLVEHWDDAIVCKTLDGVITGWNAGAERLYGYSAREVIGRTPVGITIPEAELPKILARVGRGERVDHYETTGVTKDGRRVDVSVTVSPIRDAAGGIIGAASIARDITHRKEAEAAIREGNILRCVASLAAAAAHEINNPLAVVMGYLDLMTDDADATERARIGEIVKAVSRIQEILIRMNSVSRIEMAPQTRHLPEMLDLRRSSELAPPTSLDRS
jgi:PAS domain S-box-containing protein